MIRPYKFLDYYELADAEIFFGRELEVEKLLSDIISARLVLLFAKTGSGKTSLINAGVRPRLKQLNYETFYIRVEKDPTVSAVAVLQKEQLVQQVDGQPLDAILAGIVEKREKPIVLFFDQFEEFFLYIFDEKARNDFISTIARIYRNRDSSVHVVFSFREEFFVEMEAFRNEIPSIFQNESNLRLKWFTKEQARDVIVKPAEHFGVKVKDELVQALLKDLNTERGIEPARLQIVCDTLWGPKGSKMPVSRYRKLGRAERIIERRLEQDIDEHLADAELRLFEKLLPALRTEVAVKTGENQVRGRVFEEILKPFKYGRTIEDLLTALSVDEPTLRTLLQKLKDLGLLKEVKRFDDIYIEWTSDYLADLTDFLARRVRAILLQRLLRNAMIEAARVAQEIAKPVTGSQSRVPLSDAQLEALHMSPTDFGELSEGRELLVDLNEEQARFLFVAALQHSSYSKYWFDRAQSVGNGTLGWQVIEQKITDEDARFEQAESAVKLLGEIKDSRAVQLLGTALKQDSLAPLAIRVLAEIGSEAALAILKKELFQEKLVDLIIDSLSQVRSSAAVQLIGLALKESARTARAENALERISRSKSYPVCEVAEAILSNWRNQEGVSHELPTTPAPPAISTSSGKSLKETDWQTILRRIKDGRCSPILGPEASSKYYPSAATFAHKLAVEFNYPLENNTDLPAVAQFVSVEIGNAEYVGARLRDEYERVDPPEPSDSLDSLSLLARLPFRIYFTTTYDDLIVRALRRSGKNPRQEICRWHKSLGESELKKEFTPSVSEPLVFHFFGHIKVPESLVLSSRDYFQFLIAVSKDPPLIPPRIERTLTSDALQFLDFSFSDFRSEVFFALTSDFLRRSGSRTHLAVIREPFSQSAIADQQAKTKRYVAKYFESYNPDIRLFPGTLDEFTAELHSRWQAELS